MAHLSAAALRRLRKLPQIPSVWEGDKQPLREGMVPRVQGGDGDCLLWVDGTAGVVRAMDVVPTESNHEAMVRSLLQAMEFPQGAPPGRPQKIVVRDRELHFYLRGILSELDIKVEWQPELPLIDEIYSSFEDDEMMVDLQLPDPFDELLPHKAETLWEDAPWDFLADHHVLAIELNRWDTETLYVSIMGMLGMEYGILFYRSLEALTLFRQRVQDKTEADQSMEEAFLQQDCLFVTYEALDDEDEDEVPDLEVLDWEDIEPRFGVIHPLEGLRPVIDVDECAVMAVAMEALHRFVKRRGDALIDEFIALSSTFKIPDPTQPQGSLSVKVSTLPEVAAALMDDNEEEEGPGLVLREDLIPERAELGLGVIPWVLVDQMKSIGQFHRMSYEDIPKEGEGLPVLIIRTSRPKAKTLIQTLHASEGTHSICFNTGVDPSDGSRYDLHILKTGNGDMYLVGEFAEEDPTHIMAKKRWDRRCRSTGGMCGLLVAMGVTSQNRQDGTVHSRHMVALFEVQAVSPHQMGLSPMLRLGINAEG